MKLLALSKREQNEAALDPWTMVHFGTGLASGLMGVGFWTTLGGAIAYELVEQVAERHRIGQAIFKMSKPETAVNATIDVAIYLAGWYMGRRWNER